MIQFANAQARLLFGRELLGLTVETLVTEAQRERHLAHRAEYTAHPQTRPMGSGLELVALHADGSEFPVEISLSPGAGESEGLIIATVRDVTERVEAEHERERTHDELATRQERESLANDLHDDLVQSLYALGLSLPALRDDGTVTKTDALDQVRAELGAAIADIRAYVQHLRDLGDGSPWLLRERLHHMVDALPKPPRWTLDVRGQLSDHGMERQVFLLVKELVSNVVRHADAERAGIAIEIGDSEIAVEVRDDGSGFERAEVAETSLGLRSMEDRVAALGGSMLVETGPKAGTAVRISLPLAAST